MKDERPKPRPGLEDCDYIEELNNYIGHLLNVITVLEERCEEEHHECNRLRYTNYRPGCTI